jgi:mono/diheme cytochrome c family protein
MIKRIGIGFVGIVTLVFMAVFIGSSIQLNRDYENFSVSIDDIPIPGDEGAVARGEHIATIRYCGTCHGEDLSGGYLLNEPVLAVVPAPNLTAGIGGIGGDYSNEDWIRAIRHGVGQDGRGLVGMPSRIWHQMSAEDLGNLVAYLKTIPAVDNQLPERAFGPLFRVLLVLGQAPASEAALIDHEADPPAAPTPGVSLEYGEYLALGCTACHGEALNGGQARDFDGELVTALNLTPGGELAGWTEAEFIATMRTGITPGGRALKDLMPWQYLGQMTDEELQAIWLYLGSLPALEQGTERTDV